MSPVLKNALWDLFAPILALMSILDWYSGDLSGYWCFVVCLLAAGYFWESLNRSLLLWHKKPHA